MPTALEKTVKNLLKKNKSKEQIYHSLGTDSNCDALFCILNSLPLERLRRKTYPITLFLVAMLTLLTIKQCLFIYLHDNSNVSLIMGLIGPIIHLYTLRQLLLNHKKGYQLLPLLSVLALLRPENRIVPDMYMYLFMAIVSGILYLLLFPKNDQLKSSSN